MIFYNTLFFLCLDLFPTGSKCVRDDEHAPNQQVLYDTPFFQIIKKRMIITSQ